MLCYTLGAYAGFRWDSGKSGPANAAMSTADVAYLASQAWLMFHSINYSQHLIADSIKDDINFNMPAVDNDFLLLFYNLKVQHLKGLVGAEHPAQKMFVCVSAICERFEKLQHKNCSIIARKIITEEIIDYLQSIVGYIDKGEIPDTAGDEPILWFEFDDEIYTLYEAK